MSTTIFERIALAQLLVGGCAVVVGLIEHSQAQPVNIPHVPPPPVFNPSSPNTVPQPSYTPSTPSTRSTVPGAEVTICAISFAEIMSESRPLFPLLADIMPTISQESLRQQQQLAYNGTALQHFVRSRRLAKR